MEDNFLAKSKEFAMITHAPVFCNPRQVNSGVKVQYFYYSIVPQVPWMCRALDFQSGCVKPVFPTIFLVSFVGFPYFKLKMILEAPQLFAFTGNWLSVQNKNKCQSYPDYHLFLFCMDDSVNQWPVPHCRTQILSLQYRDSTWALPASVAQLDAPFDWRPEGRGFNPRQGRQHSFVEIDHEIFSMVILSLPLIQEGQLWVSGKRMCTLLVNHLED